MTVVVSGSQVTLSTGAENGGSLKFQKLLQGERTTHTVQGRRQVWEAETVSMKHTVPGEPSWGPPNPRQMVGLSQEAGWWEGDPRENQACKEASRC